MLNADLRVIFSQPDVQQSRGRRGSNMAGPLRRSVLTGARALTAAAAVAAA